MVWTQVARGELLELNARKMVRLVDAETGNKVTVFRFARSDKHFRPRHLRHSVSEDKRVSRFPLRLKRVRAKTLDERRDLDACHLDLNRSQSAKNRLWIVECPSRPVSKT
jgi:hypothetical protein